MQRRKSLLVGINYTGSDNALEGCHADVDNVAEFIRYRGYGDGIYDQIVLRDDDNTDERYMPTGHNILAAMDWLIAEENTKCFLHYSGHGGQVDDPSCKHSTGLLDTIVPVDFRDNGQIDADTLHRHLVSKLAPNSTLFIILDCCHSGSTLELPYVYRSDNDGNIRQLNGLEAGMRLISEARRLLSGSFGLDQVDQARDNYAGATSFFSSFKHRHRISGLGEDEFARDWPRDAAKTVTMFSGCRDNETSADAQIHGVSEGAMSWAFLESLKSNPDPTYVEVSHARHFAFRIVADGSQALHATRALLKASEYTQVSFPCPGSPPDC